MTRFLTALLVMALAFATSVEARTYSHDKAMEVATINGVELAYTVAGDVQAPAVILVMGLTASHKLWPEALVNGLTEQGYRVVLFDNRDTGDSERLARMGEPTLWWQMLKNVVGFGVDAPYKLSDMAQDVVGVMDELGIKQGHVVGASMGGMIAQIVAAEHSDRVSSLVSIMSTTGAPDLPEAQDGAGGDLMEIGGAEEDQTRALNEMGIFPGAFTRQLLAIVDAGDRTEQVKSIGVPTLVVHGAKDPLLPLPHGERTHENIAGSRMVVYDNMAHDLPDDVVPQLVTELVSHFGAE